MDGTEAEDTAFTKAKKILGDLLDNAALEVAKQAKL